MKILEKYIKQCAECKRFHGWVLEEYNGKVPVHCKCDLQKEVDLHGRWKSPCMICPNGDKFWWTPISDHKEDDGKWWHTPHFAGPAL